MRMPLEPGRYSSSCQRLDVKLNIMILYFSEIHLSKDKSPCKIYSSANKKSGVGQVGHRNSTPLIWIYPVPGQKNYLPNRQRHNLPNRIFKYIRIIIPNIRIPFSVFVPIPTLITIQSIIQLYDSCLMETSIIKM